MRAAFTFPACAFAQGEKVKNVILTFSKKVHENLGELSPAIFRELEGKPERFSPLSAI